MLLNEKALGDLSMLFRCDHEELFVLLRQLFNQLSGRKLLLLRAAASATVYTRVGSFKRHQVRIIVDSLAC